MVAGAGWHCAGVVYFVDGVEGMSTAPVMSVTDELLAELDAKTENFVGFVIRSDTVARLVTELRRLRAENAELAKDAGRYRWLRDNWFQIYSESRGSSGIKISIGDTWNHAGCADHVDTAIDTAMATQ